LSFEGLHHCINTSLHSSPDMLSPHGFQLLNLPQMLTRKIPTIATWYMFIPKLLMFYKAFYICSVFCDESKVVASCHSQYSFESCCCCCCFHKPSEWIVNRMWLVFTNV
jgi:hypothetical protein